MDTVAISFLWKLLLAETITSCTGLTSGALWMCSMAERGFPVVQWPRNISSSTERGILRNWLLALFHNGSRVDNISRNNDASLPDDLTLGSVK